MSKALLLAACLAVGAAGGFAAFHLAAPSAPADSRDAAEHGTSGVSARELEKLERRIDEVASVIRSRGERSSRPTEVTGEPAQAAVPPADASTEERLAALEKRLAALEKAGGVQGPAVPENLSAVPTKELDALGRTLVQAKRHAEAERVFKEVLGRADLDEAQRTGVEMQLGWALRGAGRFADAEARFLETQRRVGEDSEDGAWAGFQAAWDRYYLKDVAGASVRMERSANATGVSAIVRAHSLYNAASFAKEAGDTARARSLLERLLDRYAGDIPESQAFMKTQAEKWLKEIRGY